jgi:hypothetical protein
MPRVLTLVTSLIALTALALGVWIWTGYGAAIVPWHVRLGFLLVLVLLTSVALAARAGAPIGRALLAVVFILLLPVVGLAQRRLLLGPTHWIIQVVHLLVAIAAVGTTQRLAAGAFRKPQ